MRYWWLHIIFVGAWIAILTPAVVNTTTLESVELIPRDSVIAYVPPPSVSLPDGTASGSRAPAAIESPIVREIIRLPPDTVRQVIYVETRESFFDKAWGWVLGLIQVMTFGWQWRDRRKGPNE